MLWSYIIEELALSAVMEARKDFGQRKHPGNTSLCCSPVLKKEDSHFGYCSV